MIWKRLARRRGEEKAVLSYQNNVLGVEWGLGRGQGLIGKTIDGVIVCSPDREVLSEHVGRWDPEHIIRAVKVLPGLKGTILVRCGQDFVVPVQVPSFVWGFVEDLSNQIGTVVGPEAKGRVNFLPGEEQAEQVQASVDSATPVSGKIDDNLLLALCRGI